MKLYLKRSQRSGGLMGGKIYFSLDARIDFTSDEKGLISKYKLGEISCYSSETTKTLLAAGDAAGATGTGLGYARGILAHVAARFTLNCTLDSLGKGQHIECKDLDELLGADAAIRHACATAKGYLDTAATFDGREEVVDFGQAKAAVVP